MPLKPIDLQINVSQMDHISRAQAASKEAVLMAQTQLAEKIEQEARQLASAKIAKTETTEHLKPIREHDFKGNRRFSQQQEDSRQEPEGGTLREEAGVLTNYDSGDEAFKEEGVGSLIDLKG